MTQRSAWTCTLLGVFLLVGGCNKNGGGGKIRIVDATTNKQVAKTTVPPQSIIQIDSEKGVVMGTNTLAKGPLPSDHRYELWLDR